MPVPVKRHRGEPGHTKGHARDTRERTGTRITQTNLTTSKATNTQPARQRDDRARRPKPRPTQQPQPRSRPLPAADSKRPPPRQTETRTRPPYVYDRPPPRHRVKVARSRSVSFTVPPTPRHPLPERLPVRVIPVPVRVFEPPAPLNHKHYYKHMSSKSLSHHMLSRLLSLPPTTLAHHVLGTATTLAWRKATEYRITR